MAGNGFFSKNVLFVWPSGLLRGERKVDMNHARQLFADYLAEKGIIFDLVKDRGITFGYAGKNVPHVRVILIFAEDGSNVEIRFSAIAKVPNDKLAKTYELCSKLNNTYRWVKFFVNSDNEITAQDDGVIEPNTMCKECFELIARGVDIIDDVYPEFMAVIWGTGAGVSAPQKR